MAYYLSNERNSGVLEAYRRYQQYLRDNEAQFPRGACALATAEWTSEERNEIQSAPGTILIRTAKSLA